MGGVLVFIFNVPMKKLEDFLDKCRVPQKLQRGLALVLEVLILALIMTGIISISVGAHHRHADLIFGIGLSEGGSGEER